MIYVDLERSLQQEVVSFWEVVRRKKNNEPIYQLPKYGLEIVNILQQDDFFIMGLDDGQINWKAPDLKLLKKHLYRVQRFSNNYYEFRWAHMNNNTPNEYPYYIRISNLGRKYTGWTTHNPIKVMINPLGEIIKFDLEVYKRSLNVRNPKVATANV